MSTKVQRTVVIAEDDLEVAQVLGRIVRALGHATIIAHDGAEALEVLRNNKVDLLLSDIDMPRMDGITLLSHARAEQLAPVRILLTANARLDNAISAINSGEVHRYILKPWRHDDLVNTLEDAFLRIDDLSRMNAAGQAAKRLRAACEALEAEYPGLTHVELTEGAYDIDPKRAGQALELLDGTTLAALLSTTVKPGG
ncbi:MAG TPA: response regulator [Polyangiales bacterium]